MNILSAKPTPLPGFLWHYFNPADTYWPHWAYAYMSSPSPQSFVWKSQEPNGISITMI
jgi:hypothetical protein